MSRYQRGVLPIAEYVYTEHFKEMDASQDVYATFAGKRSANEKFVYAFNMLSRYDWLPQSAADGSIKLSPAHRRWRKRLKRRLHKSRVSIDMDCSTPRKNGDVSDAYRSRGNEAFKAKHYEESLKCYTLSAMTADAGSAHYALAVANRSAALYHLDEHEHCLKDVERALSSDAYPAHSKYKLLERKGTCYRHTDRGSLAVQTYSDCLKHLNSTQLSLAEKEIIQNRVKESIRKCNETKETEEKTNETNIKCIRLTNFKNNDTTVLSKFVELKYSEGMGRGLFVSKDTKPGEILIVEKPFAGVYKNNMWIFNCDYCFKRCLSAIPCPKCSQVLYCDDECLNSAYDSYHNVECSLVYPLKGDPTVEPVHDMALRCFIQLTNAMGLDRYCSAVTEYTNNCSSHGSNNSINNAGDGSRMIDFVHADTAFRSVYGLDGNESKRTVSNMFSMHCTASMIVSVLLLNGFRVPPCSLGTVGESLVHLLCVSNLNSYASAEPLGHVGQSFGGVTASGSRALNAAVAFVLCPSNSLINHSCDPNVVVQTHGGVEVIRALQPISKGSQMFIDYGVNFMSHDKDDRNLHLWDQYQFECQCQACTQNWPTSEDLDELSDAPHPTVDTQLIGIPDTTLAEFSKIVYLLSTHQKLNVDCLDFLFSFLHLLYSCNLKKPCSIYYKCIRVIKKCLYSTSDQIKCVND